MVYIVIALVPTIIVSKFSSMMLPTETRKMPVLPVRGSTNRIHGITSHTYMKS